MKTDVLTIPLPDKSTNVRLLHSLDVRRASFQLLSWLAPTTAARVAAKFFLTPPAARPLSHDARALFAAADDRFSVKLETDFGGTRETSYVSVSLWGKGPAVYLLHGWGGRSSQWGSFIEPLVRAGYTAVALDAPGHGDSPASRTSILHFAAALAAVVESVGPARALIGHSLGGAAASLAMRRGLSIERAVFVGVPADPAAFFDLFLTRLGIPDRLRGSIRARVENEYGFSWRDLKVSAREARTRLGHDVPALVVHDSSDKEVDYRDAARIIEAWPDAVLFTTHGLGHQRILRDREVVHRIVSWLTAASTLPSA